MNLKKSIKQCVRLMNDRKFRFSFLESYGFLHNLSDERYLKKMYHVKLGKRLDLTKPQGFNAKLQWLKLHDYKPSYQGFVDKYEAKLLVAELIGEEHIIPTLGVWSSFDEIPFDKLPNAFVLKCTHDSGGLVLCKDKNRLDKEEARKKISGSLARNWFYHGREYPYKNIPPRIIAEPYMVDSAADGDNLTDYKFFCFHGEPRYVMTVRDRSLGVHRSLHRWYNMDWELEDLDLDYRSEIRVPEPKPEVFEEMVEIVKKLSKGLKHVRVDLYLIDHKIYFGELTFYHKSGFEIFEPEIWDQRLGDLIHIDE